MLSVGFLLVGKSELAPISAVGERMIGEARARKPRKVFA